MRVNTGGNSLKIVVLVVATVLVSGSQCARVGDQALGPDLTSSQQDQVVKECFKSCQETAREARQEEQKRYILARHECTDSDCRRQEAAIHQANLEQIAMIQEQCESGCHEQGTGGGGE